MDENVGLPSPPGSPAKSPSPRRSPRKVVSPGARPRYRQWPVGGLGAAGAGAGGYAAAAEKRRNAVLRASKSPEAPPLKVVSAAAPPKVEVEAALESLAAREAADPAKPLTEAEAFDRWLGDLKTQTLTARRALEVLERLDADEKLGADACSGVFKARLCDLGVLAVKPPPESALMRCIARPDRLRAAAAAWQDATNAARALQALVAKTAADSAPGDGGDDAGPRSPDVEGHPLAAFEPAAPESPGGDDGEGGHPLAAVWKPTAGSGGPDQTSKLSSSVTSKSISLIFGRIDGPHRVLEAQTCLCRNLVVGVKI